MEKWKAYQKVISRKFFNFLCNLVGCEKTVKVRRLFFKIYDDVTTDRYLTNISSGSRSEGLNMKGSDIDIMKIINLIPVYHCKSQIDNIFGLITDTDNAAPGFVLLKHPDGHPCLSFNYTYTPYGLLFSSEEFKQDILNTYLLHHPQHEILRLKDFKIHGPCISTSDNVYDFAFCLKSETWPSVCIKWFHRTRYSTWPSSNDVTNIANAGLLYVPIGSKFGSKNENSLEWRISFSVPEKILVHSFNQTQLMCYALLKIVLKEVINTNSHLTNLLCSFFIKTVVFWLAEESDPSSWNPGTLLTCFQSCFDRLIYWVRIGYCPNYFMPENNMFEGKIVEKSQRNLLNFLTILRREGLKLINRSETLSKFLTHDTRRYHTRGTEAEDIAIYPLLPIMITLNDMCYTLGIKNKILQRISGHLVNGGQLTKSLYLLYLFIYYYFRTQTIPYTFNIVNKNLYRSYKLLLSHCLIAKNINVVSGGVLLAAFFYRHKEYEKSLSVANYALQECTPDKYFVFPLTGLNSFDSFNSKVNGNNSSNISFLQRHKMTCIYVSTIRPFSPQSSVFQIKELTVERLRETFLKTKEDYHTDLSYLPPNIILHYLCFMCFHHLGKFAERNICFKDIKFTLEEGFLIADGFMRYYGLSFFTKAAQIANCLEECKQEQNKAFIEITKLVSDFWLNKSAFLTL